MSGDIAITGLAELNKLLQDLPAKIEANILRGALRAGTNVIRDEARRRCPVALPNIKNMTTYGAYRGALRDSIRVGVRIKNGTVTATVKAGNKIAYYAHMVEYGTRAHEQFPSGTKSLFIGGMFKMHMHHPGAAAKPFMRPAFDTQAQTAIQAAADYMAERIPKELEKQS